MAKVVFRQIVKKREIFASTGHTAGFSHAKMSKSSPFPGVSHIPRLFNLLVILLTCNVFNICMFFV